MRIGELLIVQSSGLGFLWKYQMLLGALLVLTALTIVLVPELLIVLTAAGIFIVGAGLIGSAWEMRQMELRRRESSMAGSLDW